MYNNDRNKKNRNSIAFSMTWRSERLCFVFYGVTNRTITNIFRNIRSLYNDCEVITEKARITNSKYSNSVVATITNPHTNILPIDKWPMMIARLLKKSTACEVTYFDDFNKFLNI